MRVLVSGATGFIGSRLCSSLEALGHEVRAGSRDPAVARARHPTRAFVRLDLDDRATLAPALESVESAFFLVHGMAGGRKDYAEFERKSAGEFGEACASAGVKRIVYLGGVAPPEGKGSPHLWSRLETGRILRAGSVPCLELRASMVVGHGSASWRIVRDLAARLPAMLLPNWLEHRTEPVAIDDVIESLVAALSLPLPASEWTDLPGPEVLTGREVILRTAGLLGSHPRTLRVPLLTPRLSARWLWLVSGVDYHLAQELVDGFRSDLLAQRHDYRERAHLGPGTSFDEAARRALAEEARAGTQGVGAWAWERLVRFLGRR